MTAGQTGWRYADGITPPAPRPADVEARDSETEQTPEEAKA
jgi:hypothetical protein